jgi:hypothetical protein
VDECIDGGLGGAQYRKAAAQPARRTSGRSATMCMVASNFPRMQRIIINGEEIRSPLARFVLLVAVSVIVAVVLASAAAWVLILLGLGTVVVVIAAALALLVAAVAVPWAIVSALLRRGAHRSRW